MKNKLINLLLLTLLFIGQGAYAVESLSAKRFDPQAKAKADNLYNKAHRAYSNGNYEKAIELYKESYEYKPSADVSINLGAAYDEVKDYSNAIKWYKRAYEMGDIGGINNLGLLYDEKLKDYANAIKWYKQAIAKGSLDAYDNISLLYHDIKKDDLTATAYYLATIDKSYSKKQILDFLRNDWKIDEKTLKKAYELQKTLVPNPYTGGID